MKTKLYNLRGCKSGLWFVLGAGFTAVAQKSASRMTQAQVDGAKAAGFEPATAYEVKVTSYAVNYIREGDIDNAGNVKPNTKNPSKRRFATRDEANQHGSRFGARKAAANAPEGSAGHIGYYVTETNDPVNASVNWKTGLTNSL